MTPTIPCQTCWADDPISGAAHGCSVCQAVVALADESPIDRFLDACIALSELTDEPTQDDLDALEDGIGTRPVGHTVPSTIDCPSVRVTLWSKHE